MQTGGEDYEEIPSLEIPLPAHTMLSTLPICTDEVNYHKFDHIHVNWDGLLEVQTMRKLAGGGKYTYKEAADVEWKKEEDDIAKKHPR